MKTYRVKLVMNDEQVIKADCREDAIEEALDWLIGELAESFGVRVEHINDWRQGLRGFIEAKAKRI
jgi:hypothetical protein